MFKKLMCGLVAMAMLAGSQVFAQEAADEKDPWIPSLDFSVKYASRYLSKGKVVNPESMLFGDLSVGLQGFYAGVWVANDWNDYNKADGGGVAYEPEEIDYYFGYSYDYVWDEEASVKGISLDLCLTYWDYPKRLHWQSVGEQQWEYAFSANLDTLLSPGFSLRWDPENEKWYGDFNVAWDYNFKDFDAEFVTFNTGLNLWWGNHRFYANPGSGKDITFTTLCWDNSFDFAVCDHVTVSIFQEFAWALNHNYRDSWKGYDPNAKRGMNTLWGVKLAFSF